jgi:hypothetical protein
MTSIPPTDTPDGVELLASLERRVADLEARSRSSDTWRGWLRSLLRWLAVAPPLLLVLLAAIDRLSSATALPLGLLLVVVWASAAVLWAAVEVLAGGDLRFRLPRLILIVAMLAVIMGYWQVTVHQPYLAEQRCLASLKGSRGIRRKPFGQAWLIRLLGEASFQRVYSIELVGPEADGRQIRRLHALPHLTSLWLTGPGVDDGIIDDLLWLTGRRVDDGILDDVPDLPALGTICFDHSRVTESGAERLRRARPWLSVYLQ